MSNERRNESNMMCCDWFFGGFGGSGRFGGFGGFGAFGGFGRFGVVVAVVCMLLFASKKNQPTKKQGFVTEIRRACFKCF